MISIAVVGLGNVGTHLYTALAAKNDINAIHINSRKLLSLEKVDLVILAVADDAISEVSSQIKAPLVVHTSGGVSITKLQNVGRKGVFYPLQTFTKDQTVDFLNIPICLEVSKKSDIELLEKIASLLSNNVYHIDSEQRKRIHVAAVFVNNFVNHMYTIAYDICKEHNIPFDILQPLIQETALKIQQITPKEAQTGPAKRKDVQTLEKHLLLLQQQQQEIYTKLTQSIQTYGKKL
jgi:predicted short-subunit dehydrogenase-like oxidoreductase (DUF2520 family)